MAPAVVTGAEADGEAQREPAGAAFGHIHVGRHRARLPGKVERDAVIQRPPFAQTCRPTSREPPLLSPRNLRRSSTELIRWSDGSLMFANRASETLANYGGLCGESQANVSESTRLILQPERPMRAK
jgi:hypothetical protein